MQIVTSAAEQRR